MQRLIPLAGAILLVSAGYAQSQSTNLDIYWIDVEGGAATLLVAPGGTFTITNGRNGFSKTYTAR